MFGRAASVLGARNAIPRAKEPGAWRAARAPSTHDPMVKRVLLAHPPGAEALARGVAAELKALGYDVKNYAPNEPRTGNEKVVLLWSRAAWGTPALRAAARKAKATGSLVCVRLDSAPPPLVGAHSARLGKRVAWRRLLNTKPSAPVAAVNRPVRARLYTARAKRAARPEETVGTDMRLYSESSSRAFAIVLSLCLVGAAALGFAYQRYPQVAAPIDSAAAAAYAQASELAALAP